MQISIPRFNHNWSERMYSHLSRFELSTILTSVESIDGFVARLALSWGDFNKLDRVAWVLDRLGEDGTLKDWIVEECHIALEEIEYGAEEN